MGCMFSSSLFFYYCFCAMRDVAVERVLALVYGFNSDDSLLIRMVRCA